MPDSGEYDPDHNNVKYRSPSALILGKRPNKQESSGDPGAGHYDLHDNFGDNLKLIPIGGKSKEDRPQHDNGPGDYEHVNDHIKPSVRSHKFSQEPRDKSSPLKKGFSDQNPGPGHYNDHKGFGEDVKGLPIREIREPDGDKKTPGVGEYNVNEDNIRSKIPNTIFAKEKGDSKTRQSTNQQHDLGPGAYHDNSLSKFTENVKGFKIQ